LRCIFATDLHGRRGRFPALFSAARKERPDAVLLGGDLLPGYGEIDRFIDEEIFAPARLLKEEMERPPELFVIMGNDDRRQFEGRFIEADRSGIIHYMHMRKASFKDVDIYGCSFVPPTPVLLKDWERYDVSRHLDVGDSPIEEGIHTTDDDREALMYETVEGHLKALAGDVDMSRSVLLLHAPPYNTYLDRAALDGMMVDHAPLDVHVGSFAIRRFIEERQPLMTLHGHIHESASITGRWMEKIGRTVCLSAAFEGDGLCLVRFDTEDPEGARREVITV